MQIPPYLFSKPNRDVTDRRHWLARCGFSLLGLSAFRMIASVRRLSADEAPLSVTASGSSSAGWPFERTEGNFVVYSNHRLGAPEVYLQELE
ncbi:MAG: hypothetical protein RLY14_1189, partial [Planctomycetota bacterium]